MNNKMIDAILNVLGVDINQEFKITGIEELYRFNECGVLEFKLNGKWLVDDALVFLDLIYGKVKVEVKENE